MTNAVNKKRPPAAGIGRKKGVPNKTTAAVKDAILRAFEKVGGSDYLEQVAINDPKTFCALLGKVLPMQVVGAGDGPITLQVLTAVPASPEAP